MALERTIVLILAMIKRLLASLNGKQRAIERSIFMPPESKKNKSKMAVKRLIAVLLMPLMSMFMMAVARVVKKAKVRSLAISRPVLISR